MLDKMILRIENNNVFSELGGRPLGEDVIAVANIDRDELSYNISLAKKSIAYPMIALSIAMIFCFGVLAMITVHPLQYALCALISTIILLVSMEHHARFRDAFFSDKALRRAMCWAAFYPQVYQTMVDNREEYGITDEEYFAPCAEMACATLSKILEDNYDSKMPCYGETCEFNKSE